MNEFDFKLLQAVSLPSYDNGEHFTHKARLKALKKHAKKTAYKKRVDQKLFTLFSKRSLDRLGDFVVVLSTHIDAVEAITEFYAEKIDEDTLQGTFDNTLTNAAVLSLMYENALANNVLIAFTGDEESDSNGATELAEYLEDLGKTAFVIVLDVTNIGYNKVSFTVENKFFTSPEYHNAIRTALYKINLPYRFVAYEPFDIPEYVPIGYVELNSDGGIYEALCDESWAYNDEDIECFSLCIPVKGEMHDNCGVLSRKADFTIYKHALVTLANCLADSQK